MSPDMEMSKPKLATASSSLIRCSFVSFRHESPQTSVSQLESVAFVDVCGTMASPSDGLRLWFSAPRQQISRIHARTSAKNRSEAAVRRPS